MKFQPDRSNAQTISGYGPGWIGIDADKITHSVIIGSGGLRQPWPCLPGLCLSLVLGARCYGMTTRTAPQR